MNININMQNYQAAITQLKQMGIQLYKNQFFEQIVLTITLIIFFIIGRLSYEKRLTHLLQMVNDAETTRKNLTIKQQKQAVILTKIQQKRKYIWVLAILLILINAGLYYISKKIQINYILYTGLPFLTIALAYFIIERWYKWNKKSTQKRLKNTSITTQVQIKEILKIFGEGLKEKLKKLYEGDIDNQWVKQSKQQCKLYKCYNEKKSYQKLFILYEQIINEIKKINMCDICLSQNNISVQKLGLADLQNVIKICKKAKDNKLPLNQKKQMVNKLLQQYQKIGQKLPHICKKGCCIKQRVLIQNAKVKYHQKLKQYHAQLNASQKK